MFRVILPAAGYGTRVSAPIESGKELMLDPMTGGPLIAWSVALSRQVGGVPLVVSRQDKSIFNEWLINNGIDKLEIAPHRLKEWPSTILMSSKYWRSLNLFLLPDTRFGEPIEGLKQAWEKTSTHDVVFLTVPIEGRDPTKFALFNPDTNQIAEKPTKGTAPKVICGVFFTRAAGKDVFNCLTKRGSWRKLKHSATYVDLPWFKDITRTGKIEEY